VTLALLFIAPATPATAKGSISAVPNDQPTWPRPGSASQGSEPSDAASNSAAMPSIWTRGVAKLVCALPGAGIRLWLTPGDADITAEIEDDGPPFDPTRAPPPVSRAGLADRPNGGLGLHLMHRLCKVLEYRRECGVNRLRTVVSVPESQAPA